MPVTGLVPPIVTPFYEGRLDLESLRQVVAYVGPTVAGFLVGGSVGEHPSLTLDERIALIRAVAAYKNPEHALVASIADNSIENSAVLAAAAQEAGADLLILSPPNYYSNNLPMVRAFLQDLAARTTLDLCLYDNPLATHTAFSVADIAALAETVPRLSHIKVTDLAPDKVAELCRRTSLTVHAGEDAVLWRMLTRGAHGAMVALPMVYPAEAMAVWDELQKGRRAGAEAAYRRCSHFLHVALGASDYVQVLKTVLHERGVIRSAETRLPLCPLDARRREEVLAAL
ncbi:MAG TPA: dihydrodipicolinate synthase family protein [Chloroflexota bacterium]|nr:dihydrodipicolinate synthase family protein [Chloroflexota bacterium]